MMADRPYLARFEGEERMIEAPGPHQALSHLTRGMIESLRPATAAEALAWARANRPIERYDPKAPLAAAVPPPPEALRSALDAMGEASRALHEATGIEGALAAALEDGVVSGMTAVADALEAEIDHAQGESEAKFIDAFAPAENAPVSADEIRAFVSETANIGSSTAALTTYKRVSSTGQLTDMDWGMVREFNSVWADALRKHHDWADTHGFEPVTPGAAPEPNDVRDLLAEQPLGSLHVDEAIAKAINAKRASLEIPY